MQGRGPHPKPPLRSPARLRPKMAAVLQTSAQSSPYAVRRATPKAPPGNGTPLRPKFHDARLPATPEAPLCSPARLRAQGRRPSEASADSRSASKSRERAQARKAVFARPASSAWSTDASERDEPQTGRKPGGSTSERKSGLTAENGSFPRRLVLPLTCGVMPMDKSWQRLEGTRVEVRTAGADKARLGLRSSLASSQWRQVRSLGARQADKAALCAGLDGLWLRLPESAQGNAPRG
jgi:hypothetical protein